MRLFARSLIALQASLALGQITVIRPTRSDVPPSDETGLPTSISEPEATGEPCLEAADAIIRSSSDTPAIDAELAYNCLRSVPIVQSAAEQTVDGILNMIQFQSNLAFLANPPDDYFNEPVDLVAGLNDIRTRIGDGTYQNEYDFEEAVSTLLGRSYDGHLAYDGYTFAGAFRWRRNPRGALISGSTDGGEPRIFSANDANDEQRSPVTQINGRTVTDVIAEEATFASYHDPDARWNSMFVLQPAESSGFFITPRSYPGQNTSYAWENGTTTTYENAAVAQDPSYWSDVVDGQSFYDIFVSVSSLSRKKLRARSDAPKAPKHRIPTRLQIPKDAKLTQTLSRDGSVPELYPSPVVEHQATDVPLAGFFIDSSSLQNVAVLMIQTFNTAEAQEFQSVIQDFIAEAQSRGAERIIVDVRTNGGGFIFLGYEAYKQFFPTTEPFGGSRYRYHDGAEILGSSISEITATDFNHADLYSSPFNYHSYVDADLEEFTSWQDLAGPTEFNNDRFTNILRYNLSNPSLTNEDSGVDITLTGYGDRSDFTQPFPPENIVILSDGICASTCALFVELMSRQSGVRTFTVGGRPQPGPMQAVGGTKGSQVLSLEYLLSISSEVVNSFASTRSEARDWYSKLPLEFGTVPIEASVNFQDSIRHGTEDSGVPTQFINDTSSCRMYYTPTMYFNVTEVWAEVAEMVWGNGGNLDTSRCVGGSNTDEQAQVGANPNGGNGGSDDEGAATSVMPKAGLAVVVLLASVILLMI